MRVEPKGIEPIALAIEEDADMYDVVHRLIKLQDRAAVASEIHRRMKRHAQTKSEPTP